VAPITKNEGSITAAYEEYEAPVGVEKVVSGTPVRGLVRERKKPRDPGNR